MIADLKVHVEIVHYKGCPRKVFWVRESTHVYIYICIYICCERFSDRFQQETPAKYTRGVRESFAKVSFLFAKNGCLQIKEFNLDKPPYIYIYTDMYWFGHMYTRLYIYIYRCISFTPTQYLYIYMHIHDIYIYVHADALLSKQMHIRYAKVRSIAVPWYRWRWRFLKKVIKNPRSIEIRMFIVI